MSWRASNAAQEEVVFLSFENEADLAKAKPSGADVELSAEHATHGKQSLKVVLQPQPYPLVSFQLGSAFDNADWTQYDALAFDLYNPQDGGVGLFLQFFDGTGARRTVTCPIRHRGPAKVQSTPIGLKLKINGLLLTGANVGMVLTWDQDIDVGNITRFLIMMERPKEPTTIYLDKFRFLPRRDEPLVDRFGQYTRRDWPGKVHDEQELKEVGQRDLEAARQFLAEAEAPSGRDRFGGCLDSGVQLKPTGFFRLAFVQNGKEVAELPAALTNPKPQVQNPKSRWLLVTPEGNPFFSVGITGVVMGDQDLYWRDGGESRIPLLEWLPPKEGRFAGAWAGSWTGGPSFYKANLIRKYGEDFGESWAQVTLHRLLSWGFTTVGGWSDDRVCRAGKLPYVTFLGAHGVSRPNAIDNLPDVFDPQFAVWAEKAGEQAATRKKEPWLLGYFVDNELFWSGDWGRDESPVLCRKILKLGPESHAKRRLLALVKERHGDVKALNAAWGTTFRSFDWMLNQSVELPAENQQKAAPDFSAFLTLMAETYYRTIRDAIRKHDPNHLYLGSRFAQAPKEAVAAAGKYCDIVSFNIYEPELRSERFGPLYELARRPFLIGEWSVSARDRGMLGAAFVVGDTQEQRGQIYRQYVQSAVRLPYFVGCHWFEYLDQAFLGRHDGHESFNTGFVDVCDNPYPELAKAAAETNQGIYMSLLSR